jgi:ABC-2 type transport system ATP-binding protein
VAAITCENLTKKYRVLKKDAGIAAGIKAIFKPQYKEVEAVKGISISVEEGELVGFLGPNGAGKTTTLKMMSGILVPSSGTVSVLGYTPWDRRPEMLRKIALVMGNKNQLWWDLPAIDSFNVLAEIYEVERPVFQKRIKELTEILDIADKLTTQVRKMSLGERMKCELVAALLHAPSVIFLDEPTIGLDVVSQKRIRDFLRELHAQEGNTILLTSHYMQDVRELCKRVIIIDNGTKVFDGALESLIAKFNEERTVQLVLDRDVSEADFERYGRVVSSNGPEIELAVPREQTATIVSKLLAEMQVVDVQIHEPSIEEIIRSLFSSNQPDTDSRALKE